VKIAQKLGMLQQTEEAKDFYRDPLAELAYETARLTLENAQAACEAPAEGEAGEEPAVPPETLQANVASAQESLASAEAVLAEKTLHVWFRQPHQQDMLELGDRVQGAKARWLADRNATGHMRELVRAEVETLSDDELCVAHLYAQGIGEDYCDEANFRTPRQLLEAVAERMEAEREVVDAFAELETALAFGRVLHRLRTEGERAQYDDFPQGLVVHLTEQEQIELSDERELTPEEASARRDACVARHLAIERQRREAEVRKKKAELLDKGREQLIRELVNRAIGKRAEEFVVQRYTHELIFVLCFGEEEDGKWSRIFTGAEQVAQIEVAAPSLYRWLTERVGRVLPKEVASLVASAPFRGSVGPLPG
jgi:hypothetical protein